MAAAPTLLLTVPSEALSLFMLVLSRTTAWVSVVPLFSPKGIPSVARLGMSVALALLLTPMLPPTSVPVGNSNYAIAVGAQVFIGLTLGVLTGLILAAVDVAGSFADYASGFSYGAIIDPVNGAQSAAFGRLTSVTFLALLLVTNGYRTIIAGFISSFRAMPVDHLPSLSSGTGAILGAALAGVFVAALQIGAPLLGVLFLTEVALAIVGRFVPQANALVVGLPVKSLVALSAAGTMLALLPGQVTGLVQPAVQIGGQVLR